MDFVVVAAFGVWEGCFVWRGGGVMLSMIGALRK